MIIKELKDFLKDFPDNANVLVVVKNYPRKFEVTWGTCEGGTKADAVSICFVAGGTYEQSD